VVASLRSPAFACRDCDLLAHVQAGGSWSYLAEPPGASPECVKSGFASLRRLHARRWHLSTGALIEEVVASRHMLELAVAGTRPRESWRRLRFVAEQARGLEEAGVLTTLRQFVEWLRMQADAGARVNEGVAVEPDDDAIRIMTIHAAKGLEFEIVFLGAWAADRFKRENDVIWPERTNLAGAVEVRVGNVGRHFTTEGSKTRRSVSSGTRGSNETGCSMWLQHGHGGGWSFRSTTGTRQSRMRHATRKIHARTRSAWRPPVPGTPGMGPGSATAFHRHLRCWRSRTRRCRTRRSNGSGGLASARRCSGGCSARRSWLRQPSPMRARRRKKSRYPMTQGSPGGRGGPGHR